MEKKIDLGDYIEHIDENHGGISDTRDEQTGRVEPFKIPNDKDVPKNLKYTDSFTERATTVDTGEVK